MKERQKREHCGIPTQTVLSPTLFIIISGIPDIIMNCMSIRNVPFPIHSSSVICSKDIIISPDNRSKYSILTLTARLPNERERERERNAYL